MDLVCEFCKKQFVRPVHRRFCSKKCHSDSMRLLPKDCPRCGEEFVPEKSSQTFCTLKCFNDSAGGARDQPEPAPVAGARWIPLTQGKFALVDESIYGDLAAHKWLAVKTQSGHWYAKRAIYENGIQTGLFMHKVILPVPDGCTVDHKSGDGLDNRIGNLRPATGSQNQMNIPHKSSTGFKGVSQVRGGKFIAKVMASGFQKYLGRFKTAEEAARAYDAEARMMHGQHGRYNFPLPGERAARDRGDAQIMTME